MLCLAGDVEDGSAGVGGLDGEGYGEAVVRNTRYLTRADLVASVQRRVFVGHVFRDLYLRRKVGFSCRTS